MGLLKLGENPKTKTNRSSFEYAYINILSTIPYLKMLQLTISLI